jgi:hypothetical protein
LGDVQLLGGAGEIEVLCNSAENFKSKIGQHRDKDIKKG